MCAAEHFDRAEEPGLDLLETQCFRLPVREFGLGRRSLCLGASRLRLALRDDAAQTAKGTAAMAAMMSP